jgi:putative lipase involved disintegration of autophagic bodies
MSMVPVWLWGHFLPAVLTLLFDRHDEGGNNWRTETFEQLGTILSLSDKTIQLEAKSASNGNRQLSLRLSMCNDYPDTAHADTVLSLAKMSANAYVRRGSPHWINGDDEKDNDDIEDGDGAEDHENEERVELEGDGFGWGRAGLRGHVYADPQRTLLVIAFKGTSTLLQGGGTVARDRLVDNLMFSCCCAAVDLSWTPVCSCHTQPFGYRRLGVDEAMPFLGSSTMSDTIFDQSIDAKDRHALRGGDDMERRDKNMCDRRCLQEAIEATRDGSYLQEAIAVVQQCRQLFPQSRLLFTGHSLGAALASLLVRLRPSDPIIVGAVTFACPGDTLYARRLGIVDSRQGEGSDAAARKITHFGLTSDPVYMGKCRGPTSSCYLGGYAMESQCRVGRECAWTVRGGLTPDQQLNINTHRMRFYIQKILHRWRRGQVAGPTCHMAPDDCVDCPDWHFA